MTRWGAASRVSPPEGLHAPSSPHLLITSLPPHPSSSVLSALSVVGLFASRLSRLASRAKPPRRGIGPSRSGVGKPATAVGRRAAVASRRRLLPGTGGRHFGTPGALTAARVAPVSREPSRAKCLPEGTLAKPWRLARAMLLEILRRPGPPSRRRRISHPNPHLSHSPSKGPPERAGRPAFGSPWGHLRLTAGDGGRGLGDGSEAHWAFQHHHPHAVRA